MTVIDNARGSIHTPRQAARNPESFTSTPIVERLSAALADLPAIVLRRIELARSRRALSELNDEQLRDIGLTRADMRAEVARSTLLD